MVNGNTVMQTGVWLRNVTELYQHVLVLRFLLASLLTILFMCACVYVFIVELFNVKRNDVLTCVFHSI